MSRDATYLGHIAKAIQAIDTYANGMTEETFSKTGERRPQLHGKGGFTLGARFH